MKFLEIPIKKKLSPEFDMVTNEAIMKAFEKDFLDAECEVVREHQYKIAFSGRKIKWTSKTYDGKKKWGMIRSASFEILNTYNISERQILYKTDLSIMVYVMLSFCTIPIIFLRVNITVILFLLLTIPFQLIPMLINERTTITNTLKKLRYDAKNNIK
jgi:hypothetical protein